MVQSIIKKISVLLSFKSDVSKLNDAVKTTKKMTAQTKSLTELGKKHNMSVNDVSRSLSDQGVAWKKNKGWLDKSGRSVQNMDTFVKKGSKSLQKFNMNALGIMFAGMALQKVFLGLARSGVDAFTKIMESNKMMGTAVQKAAVGFEFLKFTVGSVLNNVLEPLMPVIMNIIESFSNWMQKNPKLVATLISLGIVLGTILFIGGQLWLGIASLAAIMNGSLAVAAASALIAIALLGLAFMIFMKSAKIALGQTDKEMTNWAINTESVMGFIGSIFRVGLNGIWAIFKTVFTGIGTMLASFFRAVLEGFEVTVNGIIKLLNWTIRQMNRIPGVNIGFIGKLDFAKDLKSQKDIWSDFGQEMVDTWSPKSANSTFSKNAQLTGTTMDDTSLSQNDLDFLKTNSVGNTIVNNTTEVQIKVDDEGMKDAMNTLLDERDNITIATIEANK